MISAGSSMTSPGALSSSTARNARAMARTSVCQYPGAVRLVLALVLVVVAACAPAPRELTPREVLDRAADELDKATTAHFALEQQNGSVQLAAGVQVVNAE